MRRRLSSTNFKLTWVSLLLIYWNCLSAIKETSKDTLQISLSQEEKYQQLSSLRPVISISQISWFEKNLLLYYLELRQKLNISYEFDNWDDRIILGYERH